jgi:hypothetical protein
LCAGHCQAQFQLQLKLQLQLQLQLLVKKSSKQFKFVNPDKLNNLILSLAQLSPSLFSIVAAKLNPAQL